MIAGGHEDPSPHRWADLIDQGDLELVGGVTRLRLVHELAHPGPTEFGQHHRLVLDRHSAQPSQEIERASGVTVVAPAPESELELGGIVQNIRCGHDFPDHVAQPGHRLAGVAQRGQQCTATPSELDPQQRFGEAAEKSLRAHSLEGREQRQPERVRVVEQHRVLLDLHQPVAGPADEPRLLCPRHDQHQVGQFLAGPGPVHAITDRPVKLVAGAQRLHQEPGVGHRDPPCLGQLAPRAHPARERGHLLDQLRLHTRHPPLTEPASATAR